MNNQNQLRVAVTPDLGRGAVAVNRDASSRLEILWAWASLLVLIICWDAAFRLDEHVSLPRMRIAHAVEEEDRIVIAAAEQPEKSD
ncbi:MAG TPA: hypothetical protein VKB34_12550 [Povalibacter sp.]|nr:hypothetical protein [Povalibacter sp.]